MNLNGFLFLISNWTDTFINAIEALLLTYSKNNFFPVWDTFIFRFDLNINWVGALIISCLILLLISYTELVYEIFHVFT